MGNPSAHTQTSSYRFSSAGAGRPQGPPHNAAAPPTGAAPKKEKQEKLEAAMDRLRGKFGTDVISYGAARPEKEEDPLP